MKAIAAVVALSAAAAALAGGAPIEPSSEQWQRAARFDAIDPASLIRNARIEPRWIDERRFWYLAESRDGVRPMLVDAGARTQAPLYDRARMADALHRAGVEAPAADRPLAIAAKGDHLEASFAGGVSCRVDGTGCTRGVGASKDERLPEGLRSPDGARRLFVRDHDLWLADDVEGGERRLTTDGAPFAGYGEAPDLQNLHREEGRSAAAPLDTHWSPTGRWVITRQIDERQVAPYPFVSHAPADGAFRPLVREVRVALLGDPNQPVVTDRVIDANDGRQRKLVLPDGFDLADPGSGNAPLGWSADGNIAYLYATSPDATAARVVAYDMRTATSRTLVEQRSTTGRINPGPGGFGGVSRVIGGQLLLWSERDGWGHLYLHDLATGRLVRQLTDGPRPVRAIFPIPGRDDALVILRPTGAAGDDPYLLRPSRLNLANGDEMPMAGAAAQYELPPGAVSPGGGYLVASHSTVRQPPRHALYDLRSGAEILRLEQADTSALVQAGWRPPTRLRVKAADGRTDIYAVYFKPQAATGTAAAPIVEINYSNVILTFAPVSFMDAVRFTAYEAGLTELGFAVAAIDGRGTPHRSRAFFEAGHPDFADLQVEDHVSALRQIARIDGAIDLCRVGIWGSSNGGAGTARSMLLRPDVYRVGVAAAGSHDYASLSSGGMRFFGVPSYADGGTRRTRAGEVAANYLAFDNARLATRLEGKLLLAYGELDDYAFVAPTMRLARAFIDAGKEFDLLAMPGRDHFFRREPYFRKRLRSYFVEHLGPENSACLSSPPVWARP